MSRNLMTSAMSLGALAAINNDPRRGYEYSVDFPPLWGSLISLGLVPRKFVERRNPHLRGIGIYDAAASAAVRNYVAKIAGRYSLLVSDGAPVRQGYVDPGKVRVVVTRSRASVPGCPDWSGHTADYGANATAPGFGCSINGNLAAMIADPQQLLHGATGTGETVIMSSTKAIETYREAKPTGAAGLPAISSQAGK